MSRVIIIAEAGVNHNGDVRLAKKLIEVAAEAGADYVKFQTFRAEKIASIEAQKAEYQKKNTGEQFDNSQLGMLRKLELSPSAHEELISHCKICGIRFLSTAFDCESLDLLERLGVELYKIPSGEITNLPYLRKIAGLGRPVILSTGMADLDEVKAAVSVLTLGGVQSHEMTVLHCTTDYPTSYGDVNLKAMQQLRNELQLEVGYSDHTLGIEVSLAAVAMGASVIEKHFTLDRKLEGPDHAASLEPSELRAMVKAIRHIEAAMSGDGNKRPRPVEKKNKLAARKSLHLTCSVSEGQRITEEMLVSLRPGDGISPMEWDHVILKSAARSLDEGTKIRWEDLK